MKKFLPLLILLSYLVACSTLKDKSAIPETVESNVLKVDSLLTNLNNQNRFNGNILISENGKITFNKSYGFANESNRERLNQNHTFYIASITKEFTATAIVLLKERGKLSYTDKITKYIPLLSKYKNISINNLLNHTSGIGDLDNTLDTIFEKEFDDSEYITNSDVINVLAKYTPALRSEVSVEFEYSNIGYQLLATVIEKISGMSYAEFIRKNIFEPLKMNASFVIGETQSPKSMALGLYWDDSLKTVEIANKISDYNRFRKKEGIIGSKGIYSNTNDLLIWTNNFTSNKLISEDAIVEMTTRATLKDGSKTDYGFGFELGYWKDYTSTVGHRGKWPGYSTLIDHNPENKKIIIILQNFNNPSPLSKVKRILYNIQPLVFIELSKSATDKYVGDYKTSDGRIKKIVAENGKIYAQMNPQVKLELRPISKRRFIVIGFRPEVQYEFIEENGKIDKYILRQPERGILREAIKI